MSYRHVRGKGETSVELLEEILSNQNMNQAYKRVYRNKGASGVDGVSVEKLKDYLKEHKDELRSRIRVIIWKQWKNSKKRIKSLVQLGIPKEEAKGLTFCRKGYRFIGLSKVVQKALSNKLLRQRGIPFTLEYYLKVHTEI